MMHAPEINPGAVRDWIDIVEGAITIGGVVLSGLSALWSHRAKRSADCAVKISTEQKDISQANGEKISALTAQVKTEESDLDKGG